MRPKIPLSIFCFAACAHPGAPTPPASSAIAEEEEVHPASSAGHCKSTRGECPDGRVVSDFASCTDDGCAEPGSAHALLNMHKRRAGGASFATARPLTFDRLRSLQAKSGASDDGFGEGVAVRLVGYMAPHHARARSSGVHPGSSESVNCCFAESEKMVDFHIPLRERPGQSECEGVVVEMIPQGRSAHPSWTIANLRALAERRVMFVGPLLYDREHKVHDDCTVASSQPRRMSLWEVHPIVEAYVCRADDCTADSLAGWDAL